VLTRLYYMGALKYDAYIAYISTKHAIPKECFEKKPVLDLKQLNGIQEPEPSTGKK
jgi:hypothetical protein